MVAYEVLLNDKRLYTAGFGEFGSATIHTMLARIKTNKGPIHEESSFFTLVGKDSESGESQPAEHFARVDTKIGDVITIRIVETESCDRGGPMPLPENSRD